ncbi:Clavaminate synthase-like protein [Aspergillus pseudonomiae]|nr:Clavaminate synthase-like protein [Aspergillus pseudonomiae]
MANVPRAAPIRLPSSSVSTTPPKSYYHLPSRVSIPVDGELAEFSAVLLRDSCACPLCVHESTKQRLFSAADIPADVHARAVEIDSPSDSVKIAWEKDVPGYKKEHITTLSMKAVRRMMQSGRAPGSHADSFPPPVLWSKEPLNLPDYDYDAYMKDDKTLYQLISQLRTEGLAFVTNVPGLTESLATIATRIGPVKDTFYGHTWDVRTVPAAINAAYTSHDLGFHTDLLYFQQPPHVQLLHCIQSASSGGASVFADAFKAAVDLFHTDKDAFNTLATVPVNYHYNHPDSNVYHTTKPVIDLGPLRVSNTVYTNVSDYLEAMDSRQGGSSASERKTATLVESLQKINWGPPFLAPFSNHESPTNQPALSALNSKVDEWHQAASKFNTLLQRPEYLYERKMKPGECVLFDNTRTLHSRRAFDMADVGKPRWLRGTYVDKDPYFSKLRVLQHKFS